MHRCPDDESLAALFDGLLEPEEEAELYSKMLGCETCQALLAEIGMAMEAEAGAMPPAPAAWEGRVRGLCEPSPGPLALAVRWVAGLLEPVRDALAPMPELALAVRGHAGEPGPVVERLRYQLVLAELPWEVVLAAEPDARVSMSARPLHAPPAGLTLRVDVAGPTRALASVGADGATVRGLEAERYELSVESGGRTLGSLSLSVRAGRAET